MTVTEKGLHSMAPTSNSLAQNNKTALPWVSLWLGRRAAGAAN